MTKKNIFKNLAFYIIAIGVILRVLWILSFNTYPETDFMWYHQKAVELSKGLGFLNGTYPTYVGQTGMPTAFRPIGYPLTLAILYKIFGTSLLVGKFFNVFLSMITMIYMYKLSRYFFNQWAAIIALCLFAFSPLAICYTSILGSETLFQTLLILILYNYLTNLCDPYNLGFLVGYLALVRPIGIFFGLIFIAISFFQGNLFTKKSLKFLCTFCAVFLIVISGWIIRNYIKFGEPIFSTNGGYVFYVNNNDYATGSWSDPYKYPNSPFLQYKHENSFDEVAINKLGKQLAFEWIKENPKKFIHLAFKRLYNSYWGKLDDISWAFTTGQNQWNEPLKDKAISLEKAIYRPFYILTFSYIFYTIIDLFNKRKSLIHTTILLVFLYFNAMMFVLEGNSRYVFPLHPIYSIGVGFLIVSFCSLFKKETPEEY